MVLSGTDIDRCPNCGQFVAAGAHEITLGDLCMYKCHAPLHFIGIRTKGAPNNGKRNQAPRKQRRARSHHGKRW